ncbi:hypothetical protein [Mycobacterium talmoniae]|uniref:Uncharacterized protein n=1 Tax=Mycobacterium talmoniae TaxID=1858794 RepID=A0A1S1NGZ4_9MYCO|nr:MULTISPECIES: hypothetical protein [Mycobacterium]OHV01748.1 hypothetical protein BKN37_16600 [Mycobacterium talmoniae]PQM48209.1 hypothetical protein C1Y40_01577 [Mycobacterium talmoniae]TDH57753.1 hypothetical protein E2F47_00895 [Mycobacterium eburneum]
MGDWFQRVVDVQTSGADAEVQAARLRSWLIAERIIEPVLTDCVLGEPRGHPPGADFATALADGFTDENLALTRTLWTNGMDISTGRQVYWVAEPVGPLTCPHCGHLEEMDHPQSRWNGAFNDAFTAWLAGGDGRVPCVSCNALVALNDWDWGPYPWAFGELGITMWNWPPIAAEFVARVGDLLGDRVVYNCGKL